MSERLLTCYESSHKQTVCSLPDTVVDIKDRFELSYGMFLPLVIKNSSLKFFITSDWFCKKKKAFFHCMKCKTTAAKTAAKIPKFIKYIQLPSSTTNFPIS